jgi:hypothetical protein
MLKNCKKFIIKLLKSFQKVVKSGQKAGKSRNF